MISWYFQHSVLCRLIYGECIQPPVCIATQIVRHITTHSAGSLLYYYSLN